MHQQESWQGDAIPDLGNRRHGHDLVKLAAGLLERCLDDLEGDVVERGEILAILRQ